MSSESQQPVFQIQRLYLKNLSLEQPNSPAIFLERDPMRFNILLENGSEALEEGFCETTVKVTVTASIGDKTAFVLECQQAGIFELRDIPEEELGPLLGIVCPGILYPYLRANVADAISRAGFAPLHLAEVDFATMYRERENSSEKKAA
ncbi:MAG TPA: protein-export chaperone SecB [Paucimonas sp.]|nr:protein-export chaperone SecB [Paucimonas sp.]